MLLTRCATLLPPVSADIEFKPDDSPLVQGPTYGGAVFSEVASEYDETLRIVIMWCMSKCLPPLPLDGRKGGPGSIPGDTWSRSY